MAKFSEGGRQANVPVVPGAAASGFEIVAARCKVCQSPHRREIDHAIAMGWQQAAVKRHFNGIYGKEFFTANNISLHAAKHMTLRDKAVRAIYEENARRQGADIAIASENIRTKRAAVEQVVNDALEKMQAGQITSEVKDLLPAVQILEKMDAEQAGAQVAELERQFRAFMAAVKEVVPEDQWVTVYDTYEILLGTPKPAQIEEAVDVEAEEEEESE